jgi:DNA repair protein RecO (recombination protein O)
MEWRDDAIVLAVRPHGESGAVVSLLTRCHGRHSGLSRGAQSKANRGVLMPGNRVSAWWRARLAEQLGTLKCELLDASAALAMEEAGRLAALFSACALCEMALPERQPHPALFEALSALLASLASDAWPSVYVHWELALLRDLGYGLDLATCAATSAAIGGNDRLAYVSPKSGRAVSLSAGEPYRDKLLTLPRFLVEGGEGDAGQVADGLALAGFFLDRHVLGPHGQTPPPARTRLVERLNTRR